MPRPSSLLCLAIIWASGCSEPSPSLLPGISMPLPALERPNLMLISIDTLRADYLGCYGYEHDTSPALDALAAAGTRFDDMVAASPWTLPSHATMLSGLYPSHHGAIDHEFELTAPTLATLLQAAGYHTMAIVNTKNIGGEKFGMMRGFDQKRYEVEAPTFTKADGSVTFSKYIHNSGKEITRYASNWLQTRDSEQPFFMFLHFYDVHTDFTPDARWREEFVQDYSGDLDGTTTPLVQVRNGKGDLDAADVQWLKEMYAAEIRTLDEVLATFFQGLEAEGLLESTVIAITSDHGEEFYEHGSVLHGRTYYQEQTRIPLILRGPGIPSDHSIGLPAHLIDVAPTLLSLAGVQAPAMDGVDLSRCWYEVEQQATLDRTLVSEADHNNVFEEHSVRNMGRMFRKDDYKLIYDTLRESSELYNLRLDPMETKDLSSAEPERLAEMLAELKEFMASSISGKDIGELDQADKDLMRRLGYGGIEEEEDEED